MCFGFEQMIRTRPLRRITRHFSHRTRTEGLTFISQFLPAQLSVVVDDATPSRIIGRQREPNPIPWQEADQPHPLGSRDMGQDLAPAGEFDAEHPLGQSLDNRAVDLHRSCLFVLGSRRSVPAWPLPRPHPGGTTRTCSGATSALRQVLPVPAIPPPGRVPKPPGRDQNPQSIGNLRSGPDRARLFYVVILRSSRSAARSASPRWCARSGPRACDPW